MDGDHLCEEVAVGPPAFGGGFGEEGGVAPSSQVGGPPPGGVAVEVDEFVGMEAIVVGDEDVFANGVAAVFAGGEGGGGELVVVGGVVGGGVA